MQRFIARLHKVKWVTLLGFGLLLLLPGNWSLPLLDRDEPRFAEATREMLQRNDFLIPYFNGGYRFDKPPFIYWCQAAAYACCGENAFAARLPAVVFALGTGALLLAWSRRLRQERTGFCAALMFLSCVQVLIHGRLSVADMPMVFFTTASAWSGWELSRPEATRKSLSWLFLSISLALGFLAKGPVAWLPWAGLLGARILFPASFHVSFTALATALAASLALIAAWGLPALLATHGEFLTVGIGHHVIHRSFQIMEGHGLGGLLGYVASLPLYFITVFLTFAPWAFRIPAALRVWWSSRRADPLGSYLFLQVLIGFAAMSLVRTKLPHYTLPVFPCLAFWLARRTTTENDSWVIKTAGVMTAVALAITLIGFPIFGSRLVSAELWRQVKPVAQPRMKLWVTGFTEPSLVWEFRQGITNYAEYVTPEVAAARMATNRPFCLVLPTALLNRQVPLPAQAIVRRAQGIDTTSFRKWDLTAVIEQ